jgi:hypothetical protein
MLLNNMLLNNTHTSVHRCVASRGSSWPLCPHRPSVLHCPLIQSQRPVCGYVVAVLAEQQAGSRSDGRRPPAAAHLQSAAAHPPAAGKQPKGPSHDSSSSSSSRTGAASTGQNEGGKTKRARSPSPAPPQLQQQQRQRHDKTQDSTLAPPPSSLVSNYRPRCTVFVSASSSASNGPVQHGLSNRRAYLPLYVPHACLPEGVCACVVAWFNQTLHLRCESPWCCGCYMCRCTPSS